MDWLRYADAFLAQSAPAPASDAVQSVWELVISGGWMMIPIGVCSIVALAVFFERTVSLRRSSVIPRALVKQLDKTLGEGGRAEALAYCEKNRSPMANVLATGIKRLGEPIDLLERHIQEAGEREVVKLNRRTRVLQIIAAISPLMGLLGTIFGMIEAFRTVASNADALGKAGMLASGIYEALITTAAGLLVAIPTLIAYHWIGAKIERLVMEIDQATVRFVEEHALGVNGQAPAREAPATPAPPTASTAPAVV